MRIAIFGLGGVGGYFGGRLTQTEHEIFFIARGTHLAAIQAEGLHVSSDRGNFTAQPTLATADPAEIGEVDVVILATKAWQVVEAAQAMQPLVGAQTFIVPLLNGVEAPLQLKQFYPADQVIGGYCRVLSWIASHGHIQQSGMEPFVAFGELDNRPSERVNTLAEAFRAAHVTVDLPPNIQAAMWQKLLFIAAWGGVGTITRAPIGIIRTMPELRQMLIQAMQEVYAVARERNIHLGDTSLEKALAMIDNLPDDAITSMQRDIIEGRPSELEAQNGAVVRLGAEVGIKAELHSFIYHSLLPSERRARGLLDF